MADDSLTKSVNEHCKNPATRGEWAISVASLPGASAVDIIRQAKQITQGTFRVTTVGELEDAEFKVVADKAPHALIVFDSEPDIAVWDKLRSVFRDGGKNPCRTKRRYRGGQ